MRARVSPWCGLRRIHAWCRSVRPRMCCRSSSRARIRCCVPRSNAMHGPTRRSSRRGATVACRGRPRRCGLMCWAGRRRRWAAYAGAACGRAGAALGATDTRYRRRASSQTKTKSGRTVPGSEHALRTIEADHWNRTLQASTPLVWPWFHVHHDRRHSRHPGRSLFCPNRNLRYAIDLVVVLTVRRGKTLAREFREPGRVGGTDAASGLVHRRRALHCGGAQRGTASSAAKAERVRSSRSSSSATSSSVMVSGGEIMTQSPHRPPAVRRQ